MIPEEPWGAEEDFPTCLANMWGLVRHGSDDG